MFVVGVYKRGFYPREDGVTLLISLFHLAVFGDEILGMGERGHETSR